MSSAENFHFGQSGFFFLQLRLSRLFKLFKQKVSRRFFLFLSSLSFAFLIKLTMATTTTNGQEPIFVDLHDNSKPTEIESLCMKCEEMVRGMFVPLIHGLANST
jgi:hypothetical protein